MFREQLSESLYVLPEKTELAFILPVKIEAFLCQVSTVF